MQQNNQINNKINSNKKLVDGIVRRVKTISDVEYKTDFKKTVLYSGLKMFAVSSLCFILLITLSSLGSTVSYYKDTEVSANNFLQADPLSFSVDVASSTSVKVDLGGGEKVVIPFMLPAHDSEPIQYYIKAQMTEGDSELCDSISVMTTWPFPYSGNILSLYTATSTQTGAWTMTFSVPDYSLLQNTSCTVDLIYKGWNADVPFGRGYSDTKKISLTFFIEGEEEVQALFAPEVMGDSTEATTTEKFIEEPESTTTPEKVIEVKTETPKEESITYGSAVSPAPTTQEPPTENPSEPLTEPPLETPPAEVIPPPSEPAPVETSTETPPPPPTETPSDNTAL